MAFHHGYFVPRGMGWIPDTPDPRDYSPSNLSVQSFLKTLPSLGVEGELSRCVDLREYFPSIRNQTDTHSSSAFACTALIEYFQRRLRGDVSELSSQFVYDIVRILEGIRGNVATQIRNTFKAISILGVPATNRYPLFDDPCTSVRCPNPIEIGVARKFDSLKYFRVLDHRQDHKQNLSNAKMWLCAGFPMVFAFMVPDTVTACAEIPCRRDQAYLGGQAVVAVGFDDDFRVLGCRRGAIRFRNSWGSHWGDSGYGWLPYDYFKYGVVADFWTIVESDWQETSGLRNPD